MCRACDVEVSTSVRPCEEINAVSIIRGTAGMAYIVVVSVTKIAVNAATRAIQAVISAAVTAEPVVKVTNPSFALRAAPLGRTCPAYHAWDNTRPRPADLMAGTTNAKSADRAN